MTIHASLSYYTNFPLKYRILCNIFDSFKLCEVCNFEGNTKSKPTEKIN